MMSSLETTTNTVQHTERSNWRQDLTFNLSNMDSRAMITIWMLSLGAAQIAFWLSVVAVLANSFSLRGMSVALRAVAWSAGMAVIAALGLVIALKTA